MHMQTRKCHMKITSKFAYRVHSPTSLPDHFIMLSIWGNVVFFLETMVQPVMDISLRPTIGAVQVKFKESVSPDVEYVIQYCIRNNCTNVTFTGNEGDIVINCVGGEMPVDVTVYVLNRCNQLSEGTTNSTKIDCQGKKNKCKGQVQWTTGLTQPCYVCTQVRRSKCGDTVLEVHTDVVHYLQVKPFTLVY